LIREQILPPGLNTAIVFSADGLVPCWAFKTTKGELFAFDLNVLVLKVRLFGSTEDAEVLQDEIDLIEVKQEDLDLFASQDEEYLLNT
jgi:hypothetical protein